MTGLLEIESNTHLLEFNNLDAITNHKSMGDDEPHKLLQNCRINNESTSNR